MTYPKIVGKALLAAARVQTALWDRSLRHVQRVQERTLRDIMRRNANTELGKKYGFASVRTHRDYRGHVPVGDYDSFSPYIERMRAGEQNLIVAEPIRYYGNSSGSSTQGKSKFLPIGEVQIAHQRRAGADALMRYLAWRGDDTFTSGFTIGLFPPITMRREGDTFITSNPALMMTRIPSFVRPMYLPSDRIMRMADYDEKLDAIASKYLDADVRAVAGTTCWFSLLFEKVLEKARLAGRRAEVVSDLWPNLRVLLGGGVSAAPYLPILRRLVGRDDLTLVDTYNATEGGIYAASDFSDASGMLLVPHRGTFFEFVPLAEHGRADARRVPLWEVERDVPYVIVVTTSSGLYAYEVGDIVRFPSLAPLRLEFMGRLSGCLSLTQELTTHVEIERAVSFANERCGSRTIDFGAAGDVSAKPHYILFTEFDRAPASIDTFAAAFDEGLCRENRVYREHRQRDVALGAPRVALLEPGGARRYLDTITNGNVQGKFPRILDEGRMQKLLPFLSNAGDRSAS